MKVTGKSCLVSQSHPAGLWLSCQELVALPHRIPSLAGAAWSCWADGWHLLLAELLDTLRVLPVPPWLLAGFSWWYKTAHPRKLLDWESLLSHTSMVTALQWQSSVVSPVRRATTLKRWCLPGVAQVRRSRKRRRALLAAGICSIHLLEM